ncbi:hypothetical protein [Paenibacillus sp. Marseille-Q7038]
MSNLIRFGLIVISLILTLIGFLKLSNSPKAQDSTSEYIRSVGGSLDTNTSTNEKTYLKKGVKANVKTKKDILFLLIALILAVIILLSFWFYSSKAYYPTLPFEGISKKEVVEKLDKSNNELVELSKVNGFYWLGYSGNQQEGRDKVIREMEDQGLKYDSYEGSGIFLKVKEGLL